MLAQPVRRTRYLLRFAKLALLRLRCRRDGRVMVGYLGAAGHGNVGDDAAFEGIRCLRPDVAWCPVTWYGTDFVRLMTRVGLEGPRILPTLALGGGTLISPRFVHWVRDYLATGQAMWCCGTGAGSCGWADEPQPDLTAWEPLLRRFVGLGVRGPDSARALQDLRLQGVEVCGDLALALALTSDEVLPAGQPPVLAVNVCRPPPGAPAGEPDGLGTVAEISAQQQSAGWRILPLAMDRADLPPMAELCARLGLRQQSVLYAGPHATISRLASCTAVLGMRLHSAVLAACAGTPPVMLGYRAKCLDFMRTLDLGAFHVDLRSECAASVRLSACRLLDMIAGDPGLRHRIRTRALRWRDVQKGFVDRMLAMDGRARR